MNLTLLSIQLFLLCNYESHFAFNPAVSGGSFEMVGIEVVFNDWVGDGERLFFSILLIFFFLVKCG